MDARCRIEMFGELRLVQGDRIQTRFRTHKAAALLAYLALNLRQSHARERLLDLFWAEKDIPDARNNLSTALAQLRPQLEPTGVPAHSVLVADRQNVRLNPAAVTTDVADFERLLDEGRRSENIQERIACWQRAVALYRGELLPGVYEEWATLEQMRLQTLYGQTLRELGELLEEEGRWEEALAIAQRAAQADPFDEEPYQAQIRLQAQLGRSAAALETFEKAERYFKKELGVALSAETRSLAEALKRDPRAVLIAAKSKTKAPNKATPAPDAAAPAAPPPAPKRDAPNLPLQLTRFFGREREATRLIEQLQKPETRLVTLLGPGGAGKTRLAIETANRIAAAFANRVWFIPLADLPDASLIPSALLNALQLPHDAHADPLDRIANFLGEERCLLVLDNYEHLMQGAGKGGSEGGFTQGAAALTRLLLERVPNLVCLATSRLALRIGGEQEFPLLSLESPSEENLPAPEALLAYESVALYTDRAQAARPDFALNAQNAAAVAALCRRLEGMPLAIEMAAAWAKTIPPAKMLERLEKQLDLLVSRRRDLPPRHQSLRAAIEWSYDLLEPELRQDFARLSIFRGGWTLEAAEAVCGVQALHSLVALQEQSLIVAQEQADGEPRYRMLEPLREFGLEKLAERGELETAARLHLDYIVAFSQQVRAHNHQAEEKIWMERAGVEVDNARAALRYAFDTGGESQKLGMQICSDLWWFWMNHADLGEGRAWMQRAIETHSGDATHVYVEALNGAGNLATHQGDMEEGTLLLRRATEEALKLGVPRLIIATRNNLAIAAYDTGDHALARECWEANLVLTRAERLETALSTTLSNLGEMDYDVGDFDRARLLLEEALTYRRKFGSHNYTGRNLMLLSKTARGQGRLDEATNFLREAIDLLHESHSRHNIIDALEIAAQIALMRSCHAATVALLCATDSLRAVDAYYRPPNETGEYERMLAAAQNALEPAEFARAQARGDGLSLEAAIELARTDALRSEE